MIHPTQKKTNLKMSLFPYVPDALGIPLPLLWMWCFGLTCGCSYWQKYIDFHGFVILLESKKGSLGVGNLFSTFVETMNSIKLKFNGEIFLLDSFWPILPFRSLDLWTPVTHTSFLQWFSTAFLLFSQTALSSFILKKYKGSCNQSLPCFSLPFQQLLHFWLEIQLFSEIGAHLLCLLCCSVSKGYT